jgi:hypothetical protein
VTNAVVSVGEDILAIVSIVAAVFFPVLLFVIVAAGLLVSIYLFNRVIRFFRTVARKIRSWFSPAMETGH